jgi:hypothetical protein
VKCFYCDGRLESWETEDEPFKEHTKWFSGCAFIKLRGDQEKSKTDLSTPILNKLISLDKTSSDKLKSDESPCVKLKSLQKEVEILKEARRCKICLEHPSSFEFKFKFYYIKHGQLI